MLPYSDSKLTRAALIVFFVIVIVYALYEAQGLAFGPKIAVASQAITVHEPYVEIAGRADRISSLTMNGKAIPVTETGEFSEPYLLAKGGNRIMLQAKDAYGRTSFKTVEILYIPEESPITLQTATSTTTEDSME